MRCSDVSFQKFMRLQNDLSPINHLKSVLSTKQQRHKPKNSESLSTEDYNYMNTF